MRISISLPEKISQRVSTQGNGAVFVTRDFMDLGSRAAVDQALSRLSRLGAIRRVSRGVYDLPTQNERLGITLSPSPEDVALAVAKGAASRLQVTGAHAANALGLSTQVPARIVYLTDGTPRSIRVGNQTVVFRHASPRSMATAGRASGTLIQALRYLGKNHIDIEAIHRLRQSLSDTDKATIAKDRFYAPGWMQPIIDQILAPTSRTE